MSNAIFPGFPKDVGILILSRIGDIANWHSATRVCKSWSNLAQNIDVLRSVYLAEGGDPTYKPPYKIAAESYLARLKEIAHLHRLAAHPHDATLLPFTCDGDPPRFLLNAISLDRCGMPNHFASSYLLTPCLYIWNCHTRTCEHVLRVPGGGCVNGLVAFKTDDGSPRVVGLGLHGLTLWDPSDGRELVSYDLNFRQDAQSSLCEWTSEQYGHELVVHTDHQIICLSPSTLDETRRGPMNGARIANLFHAANRCWAWVRPNGEELYEIDKEQLTLSKLASSSYGRPRTATLGGKSYWAYGKSENEPHTVVLRDMESGEERELVQIQGQHMKMWCAASRHSHLLMVNNSGEVYLWHPRMGNRLSQLPVKISDWLRLKKILLMPQGPVLFNSTDAPLLLQHRRGARTKRIIRCLTPHLMVMSACLALSFLVKQRRQRGFLRGAVLVYTIGVLSTSKESRRGQA